MDRPADCTRGHWVCGLVLAVLLPASLPADTPCGSPQPPQAQEKHYQAKNAQATQDESPTPASPVLPDWRLRRQVFWRHLFGPQAVLETVPGTAFDTARNFPRQWGRGLPGVGKRLGSQYGQFVIGEGIELGVSALHDEDPRYWRQPQLPWGQRLRHSLVATVVVQDVHGRPTPALARLANLYGSWAIATRWNPPEQRHFGKIMANGTLGLSLKAGGNLFREFWPDVRRHFARPASSGQGRAQ